LKGNNMPRQNHDQTPWGSDYGESLAEMEARIKNDLRAEYQAEKAREQFWTKLYGQAPELRAHTEIVNAVFGESFQELSGWEINDAVEELTDRVRKRVDYLERTKFERAEAAVMVGGPGLEGKPVAEQPIRVAGFTLGGVIRDRRAARSAGQRRYNRERSTNG
jgi:hypothetical protein